MKKTKYIILIFFLVNCLWDITVWSESAENTSDVKTITMASGGIFMYADSDHMNRAIEEFEKMNPGWVVNTHALSGDYAVEQLNTLLMNRDSSIDIIPVYDFMFQTYVGHGILEDLYIYDGFNENTSHWIKIDPLFMKDERLYVVPVTLLTYGYKWNIKMAAKLDVDVPEHPWTWEKFYELAQQARSLARQNVGVDYYLFAESKSSNPYFFRQYCATYGTELLKGTCNFDTEEFRSLLSIWFELWEQDLIYEKTDQNFDKLPPVLVQEAEFSDEYSTEYILMPSLESERCYPISFLGLGIHSASVNKENAADLLRIFSSKNLLENLHPSNKEYLRNVDVDIERAIWGDNISKEYLLYTQSMLELGCCDVFIRPVAEVLERQLPLFYNGTISADQLIDQLNGALSRFVDE